MAKSQLNLYCQGRHLDLPVYSTELAARGGFSSTVHVCEKDFHSEAAQGTKKAAEEDAARVALSSLRQSKSSSREGSVGGSPFYSRSALVEQSLRNNECDEYRNTSKLTSPPRAITTRKRVSSARSTDYALKLEKLCQSQGLPPPQYDEETTGEKVVVTVSVEGSGDFSSGEWKTYDEAKGYAVLIALAEIGLKFLNINRVEEDDTKSDDLISRSSGKRADTRPPAVDLPPANYKALLNEYCQKHYLPLPQYEIEFPDDSAGYIAVVKVCGKEYWSTVEMAKKPAEQKAAGKAAIDLGLVKVEEKEGVRKRPDDTKSDNLISRSSGKRADTRPPAVDLPPANYKALLNEYCQKHYQPLPQYEIEFPDDSAGYIAVVKVCGKEYWSTVEMAKRPAEQNAAGKAALDLGLVKMEGRGVDKSPIGTQGGATANSPPLDSRNFKGMLQEYFQKRGFSTPQYDTDTNYEGQFIATVSLVDRSRQTASFQGKPYGNKKSAEQDAARQACVYYELL